MGDALSPLAARALPAVTQMLFDSPAASQSENGGGNSYAYPRGGSFGKGLVGAPDGRHAVLIGAFIGNLSFPIGASGQKTVVSTYRSPSQVDSFLVKIDATTMEGVFALSPGIEYRNDMISWRLPRGVAFTNTGHIIVAVHQVTLPFWGSQLGGGAETPSGKSKMSRGLCRGSTL